jgi:hypothetical protein
VVKKFSPCGVQSSIHGGNILFLGALQDDVELGRAHVSSVYPECDEERSSDAGIGGRGAQRPVFCCLKDGWRAAGARARSAAKTPYYKMFFYGCSNSTYIYTM